MAKSKANGPKGQNCTSAKGDRQNCPSIPMGELNEHHFMQQHLDIRLTPHQAQNLKRLTVGLDDQKATLSDGRRIVRGTDALRWLLENLNSFSKS